MKVKVMVLVFSGVLLATRIEAIESKTPPVSHSQSEENLKILKEVHQHNTVFDNYHTGTSTPFEYQKK